MHLDAGYDSNVTRALLTDPGLAGCIAVEGVKAPGQAGKRWVVERTHAWLNSYGKLRRITERTRAVVEFHTHLAAAITAVRRLVNEARSCYRWPPRSIPQARVRSCCWSLLVLHRRRPLDRWGRRARLGAR